jgi:hypothetical protein
LSHQLLLHGIQPVGHELFKVIHFEAHCFQLVL